jgi:hypothetical protein
MAAIRLLVGLILLILGRKVFWLFVGAIGFVYGLNLATQIFQNLPDWALLLIALLAGLIGAGLAILLQRVAVWVAGFLAGGFFLLSVLNVVSAETSQWVFWLVFLVGGILGAVLVALVFDWALIILSSLMGATLIVQAFELNQVIATLLFVGLVVIGIVIQARLTPPARPARRVSTRRL